MMMFRRIRGRIIPIGNRKSNTGEKVAGGAVLAGGTAVAANAANTTRVYSNKVKGIAIDKKFFSVAPVNVIWPPALDTSMVLKKKGKFAAQVWYGRTKEVEDVVNSKFGKHVFATDFLYTRKAYRGQGLSKDLMKQAVIDMRKNGAGFLYNQVVHPRSAKLGGKATSDRFFKELASGDAIQVTKSDALKRVTKFWKNNGKGSSLAGIFRETELPKLRASMKPFRTLGNKVTFAAGLAVAAAGAYMLYRSYKGGKKNA